jgi:hypothetical protein
MKFDPDMAVIRSSWFGVRRDFPLALKLHNASGRTGTAANPETIRAQAASSLVPIDLGCLQERLAMRDYILSERSINLKSTERKKPWASGLSQIDYLGMD